MKIISHRGAAGLAPENTLLGIKIALGYKVEYVEVDVQPTKDGRLVLIHDDTFRAKNGKDLKIKEYTLTEIRQLGSSQHKVATLEEAIKTAGKTPLLIDCKGDGWPNLLIKTLKNFKGPRPIIACDDSRQLFDFSQKMPDARCFLSELTKPFDALQKAKALGFSGLCMHYPIYNPLLYFLAKRAKLKMTMYTVNRPVSAWFLHFFYPEVLITTDFPNQFAPKVKKRRFNRRKK